MARGAIAQQRRRQRRRRGSAAGSKRALSPVTELTAATATGFKDYPLSARDQAWEPAMTISEDGELAVTAEVDGKQTAVWRAIVAHAAALQKQEPDDELVAALRAHVEQYYAKARSVYDDPSIKTPWAGDAEDSVSHIVSRLAHAEVRRAAPDEELLERLAFWAGAFDAKLVEVDPESEVDSAVNGLRHLIGGKAFEIVELDAEEKAVAAARAAFAAEEPEALAAEDDNVQCSDCGHSAEMHVDGTGACTVEGCDCTGMVETAEEETEETAAAQLGEAFIKVRPDLSGFREAVLHEVEEALSEDLAAKLVERVSQKVAFKLAQFELVDELVPAAEAALPDQPSGIGRRWQALIVPEATMTDDFRAFAPGSVGWRQLPLTLAAMLDTPHADVVTKAEACGRIDRIWRDGNDIRAEGVFNPDDWGQKIAGMVADKSLRGISVDIAIAESEVAPRSDFFDEDGVWRTERQHSEMADPLDMLFSEDNGDPPIFVVTDGTIGSVTICPFAAFAQATIEIAASLVASVQSLSVVTVTSQHGMIVTGGPADTEQAQALRSVMPELTAAVAEAEVAVRPPVEWFDDPALDSLTPLTVDDDGRIFGHAAPWGVCHIGIPDVCTTAPHSLTDYEGFLLKEVVCADGQRVSVGTITLGTGHASRGKNAFEAVEHYDNTGTAVADISVGEDEHGIWVAGALRPNLDEETVRALRGAVLSGDWRQMRLDDGSKNLELVALLAVNVPGFPVPRTRALVASGEDGLEVVALVAAGIHFGESEEAKLNKIRALADVAAGRYAEVLARLEAA